MVTKLTDHASVEQIIREMSVEKSAYGMETETMYQFKQAKAIWREYPNKQHNQFVGFHARLSMNKKTHVKIAIAARSYYRLYMNGEMIASGPARTAEHYCRVDEIECSLAGICNIAVEVAAYSKTERYCNDCTMEPGLFIMEIEEQEGPVLLATGREHWTCTELKYRRPYVELMSHSRGIVEYYDLTEDSYLWRTTELDESPVLVDEKVFFLKRRAPYAIYRRIPFETLQMIGDVQYMKHEETDFNTLFPCLVNPTWYEMIPKENLFLQELMNETESHFSGTYLYEKSGIRNSKSIKITPGKNPPVLLWKMQKSEVGFIDIHISVKEFCILDVVNSDHLEDTGKLKNNSYVTRYCLQAGDYHLTSFEPKLVRYVKLILRTEGEITLHPPVLLEDSYPDDRYAYFQCDDEELNRIYEGARHTLRLSTLDIFMDCPERERGGWLCDSYFSSKGAWQMFGDLSVEKDFLENFMLTDGTELWKGFFPEVYPGVRGKVRDIGIRNWSFWLMLELCDYYEYSGDEIFIEQCRKRVELFVEGMLSLRGGSGLLENIGTQFVDWSLSNQSFALEPISIPINCLAVCMLERLASLYGHSDWKDAAGEMRSVIESLDNGFPMLGNGDNAFWDESRGEIHRGECQTESGIALEIWSGFHREDRKYLYKFVETMGSCPKYRSDPNIGKSNLFIGLMLRFDVLAKHRKIDLLVKELKDLYLEELKIGSGTLFESVHEFSGCHGFNGYVGTLITNYILGLGMPMQRTKRVTISPHPGELKWASGRAYCEDGEIFLSWTADQEEHVLDMVLSLPEDWEAEYIIPFELQGWTVKVNGEYNNTKME